MGILTLKGQEIKIIHNVLNLSDKNLKNLDEIQGLEDLDYIEAINLTNNQIEDLSCLSKLPEVHTLMLSHNNIADLKGMNKLKKVKDLIITFNQLSGIVVLEQVNGLEELNLYANKIQKIIGLEKLPNLKGLYLMGNQIENIENIENLQILQDLEVFKLDYNQIRSLNGIPQLENLKDFSISENKIIDINGIQILEHLERLDLSKNRIEDISLLGDLTYLKELILYINEITDITILTRFEHLEKLYLFNNKIKDMVNLSKNLNLKDINLMNNHITEIKGLRDLFHLEELVLENNQISKINGLKDLVELKYLNLGINIINEIEGLDNLVSLQTLVLAENRIREIVGLNNHKQLKRLILAENQIEEIKGLNILEDLNELNLENNNLKRIEGLESLVKLNNLKLKNNNLENIGDLLSIRDFISKRGILELDYYTFNSFLFNKDEKRKELFDLINKLYVNKKQEFEYWENYTPLSEGPLISPLEDLINLLYVLINLGKDKEFEMLTMELHYIIDKRLLYLTELQQISLFLGLKNVILSLSKQEIDFQSIHLELAYKYFRKIDRIEYKFISNLLGTYNKFLHFRNGNYLFGTIRENLEIIKELKLFIENLNTEFECVKIYFEEFMENISNIREFLADDSIELSKELEKKILKELFIIPEHHLIIAKMIITMVNILNKRDTQSSFNINELLKIYRTSKQLCVLILGEDTFERYRLERIKEILGTLGYHGFFIKELDFEIPSQTLQEKVTTIAHIVSFIIAENTTPSGHLTELEFIKNSGLTLIILQEKGKGATFMNAHYDFQHNFIKKFEYDSFITINNAIKEAVNWVEEYNKSKTNKLNKIYQWRD